MFFLFMNPDQVRPYPELKPLELALEAFCAIDPSMPVSMAATLLRVAHHGPELSTGETNLRAVARAAGSAYSTFLRQVDALADGAPRVKGLKLLEKGFNGADRRTRAVRLTPEGVRLLEELGRICALLGKDSEKIPEFFEVPENQEIPENQD